MRKSKERNQEKSCWNKAGENELMFILLERDKATPATILFWIEERLRLGLNQSGDPQIVEAHNFVREIERKLSERKRQRNNNSN